MIGGQAVAKPSGAGRGDRAGGRARRAPLVWLVGAALAVLAYAAARSSGSATLDLLLRPTGWNVAFSLVAQSASDPLWFTLLVGFANTLLLAVLSIVLATLAGFGVAMLLRSSNPPFRWLARIYRDVFRNVPLLLQIFFWLALVRTLPPPRAALDLPGDFFLSNRGLQVPLPAEIGTVGAAGVAAAGVGAAVLLAGGLRWRSTALGFILLGLCAAGLGATWDRPALAGFNFRGGGTLPPEFMAVLTGIVLYNAAFVAEIVRAGFEAVPKGQYEAARGLGLSEADVVGSIVLPQAMRLALPALANQYLYIAKATTFGVAVGLTETLQVVSIAVNQTGRALELIGVFCLLFVLVGLAIGALANLLNARIERPWRRAP